MNLTSLSKVLNYQKFKFSSLQFRQFSDQKTPNGSVNLSYDIYDKYNSENALIIAHGLFASGMSWRSIARRLNELTKQKVYTVDLRNHGNTRPYVDGMSYSLMANDLKIFIENVVKNTDNANQVSILGHSMGGKTAMTLALNSFNLIDKLIVADISPSISPSGENINSFLKKMKAIDMSALDKDLHKARKQADTILCELPLLKQELYQRQFLLTRLVDENGVKMWNFNIESIINHLNEIMDFPISENRFHKSTLFLGGELSNYITEKDVPSIKKYFTNYTIMKVPKAGHTIHFDNPSFTMKTINEFINK